MAVDALKAFYVDAFLPGRKYIRDNDATTILSITLDNGTQLLTSYTLLAQKCISYNITQTTTTIIYTGNDTDTSLTEIYTRAKSQFIELVKSTHLSLTTTWGARGVNLQTIPTNADLTTILGMIDTSLSTIKQFTKNVLLGTKSAIQFVDKPLNSGLGLARIPFITIYPVIITSSSQTTYSFAGTFSSQTSITSAGFAIFNSTLINVKNIVATISGNTISATTGSISELMNGTNYTCKAYVITNGNTFYSSATSFNCGALPTIVQDSSLTFDDSIPRIGYTVTKNGGLLLDQGILWKISTSSEDPTISNLTGRTCELNTETRNTISLTGLNSVGSLYRIRSFAKTNIGITYGVTIPYKYIVDPAIVSTSYSGTVIASSQSMVDLTFSISIQYGGDDQSNVTMGLIWAKSPNMPVVPPDPSTSKTVGAFGENTSVGIRMTVPAIGGEAYNVVAFVRNSNQKYITSNVMTATLPNGPTVVLTLPSTTPLTSNFTITVKFTNAGGTGRSVYGCGFLFKKNSESAYLGVNSAISSTPYTIDTVDARNTYNFGTYYTLSAGSIYYFYGQMTNDLGISGKSPVSSFITAPSITFSSVSAADAESVNVPIKIASATIYPEAYAKIGIAVSNLETPSNDSSAIFMESSTLEAQTFTVPGLTAGVKYVQGYGVTSAGTKIYDSTAANIMSFTKVRPENTLSKTSGPGTFTISYVTISGIEYTILKCTSPSTNNSNYINYEFTPNKTFTISYVVVGAGGGTQYQGSGAALGGGGGGEVKSGTLNVDTSLSVELSVANGVHIADGKESILQTRIRSSGSVNNYITAKGGKLSSGNTGGSSGNGNAGGGGGTYAAGGGGGSAGAGKSGTNTDNYWGQGSSGPIGGVGGDGTIVNITGSNETYGAGGQGGWGRGSGNSYSSKGGDNTGNGAAGGYGASSAPGAAGGTGIIILRFPRWAS